MTAGHPYATAWAFHEAQALCLRDVRLRRAVLQPCSLGVSSRRQWWHQVLCALAVRRATFEDKKELVDKVSAFIFDCDGVIWRGDKVIDGVPETLDWLRAQVCASACLGFVSEAPAAGLMEPATAQIRPDLQGFYQPQ